MPGVHHRSTLCKSLLVPTLAAMRLKAKMFCLGEGFSFPLRNDDTSGRGILSYIAHTCTKLDNSSCCNGNGDLWEQLTKVFGSSRLFRAPSAVDS